ncbi:hypothetical protein AMTR_s00087p00122410 [Amborella trichopoda]|uniref:Uncharacterized protein n=1 Tax=Amborella trichopoda TaxID=13333 RepID=W1P4K9_AMBTC|nr:hypothetical protein AMTR_s00087p00122410 [Amborella trichopoda]
MKGGRKWKGPMNPEPMTMASKRGSHVGKKSSSIPSASPQPQPAKCTIVEASTVLTLPPTMSNSALRVEPETNVAQPKRSSPTTFSFGRELIRAPPPIAKAMTPPIASHVGSLAGRFLSPGDFLCTITKVGSMEDVSEALGAKVVTP